MEEELLRRQALDERRLDEPARLRTVIVLLIVRQSPVREPIGNTPPLGRLLAHTGHHLRNIDGGALGPRTNHRHQTVLVGQRAETDLARLLRRLIEFPVHLVLELLAIRLARIIVEEVHMNLEERVLNRHLPLLDDLFHLLPSVLVGNQVRHAHREAVVHEELLHRVLHGVDEVHRIRGPVVLEDGVNDALGRLAEDILVEDALQNLALANPHEILLDLVVLVHAVPHVHIDRGKKLAENLLAGPALLAILLAPTLRHDALETPIPHHHIHKLPPVEGYMRPCDPVGANKSVLHDADHGLRVTGRNDLVRNGRNLQELRGALVGLRNMGVHLVAVKVRIVGRRDGYVQAERIVGQHLHAVPHHRHSVERRLAIKEDDVAVHDVAVHHVTHTQNDLLAVHVAKTDHASVGAHNRLGPGMTLLTVRPHVLNELVHLRHIVGGDLLRKGQIHRDFHGHTELRNGDVRIRRNHRARRELHTLSLDVVANAPLLRAEALLHGLQGATGALGGGRHAGDLVVHESRNVVL